MGSSQPFPEELLIVSRTCLCSYSATAELHTRGEAPHMRFEPFAADMPLRFESPLKIILRNNIIIISLQII
jgi:hypothetical protein